MSHRTIPPVNKYDYTMGLVTRFSVKNTQALIDMRDNDARTYVYERRRYATMVKIGMVWQL